jgi:ankyrin repeat protein
VEDMLDAVEYLAQRGAEVNVVNEFGASPLLEVVSLRNVRMAEVLLRHGADPNARSNTLDPVIHLAVESGNRRLVGLLLDYGAQTSYTTDLGQTIWDALPAGTAAKSRMAKLLTDRGVRRNGTETGRTRDG